MMCDESDLNQVSPTMDEFLSLEPPALVSADQLGKLEVCAGGSGDGFSSAVETFLCHICNMRYQQPRVLQCLHVFCTPCLEKLTSEENLKENGIVEIQSLSTRDSVSSGKLLTVTCPACRQDTHIETSVAELPLDVVTMNAMDIADIQALRMQCTSCKADERAVARCSDCASFLCANCVTAHKYMRLFENHKVESFDVLQKGDGISIHKPFFCSLHPIESVKFFCISCQIPVCSECILCAHKSPDHVCDRIADIETKQIEELQNLVAETRAKVAHCENASANLETVLSELQQQRDVAHDLIKESYQSYKSILEKRKDELLKELDMIHSAGELSIMDMYHAIEKAIEQMDTACQFTDRILSLGNGVEVLSMKKLVVSQMLSLINSVPCLETASPIEFLTDSDVFAAAVKATFGNFGKPGNKNCVSSPPSCPPSSLSIGGDGTAQPADRASGSPASPEMMAMLMRSGSIPGLPAVVGMGQQNVNLQQMMVERGLPRSSVSTGGQSSDGVTSANTSSLHMSALAKIGPNFVTNVQGQLPLSSQAVLGMNLNNSAAALVRANLAQRINVPVQTSTDTAAIAGLLNSVMLTPSPPASVPPAGELGNLLNSVSGGPLSTSVGVLQTGHPVSAAAVAAIAAAANIRPVPAPHLPANGGTALSIQPTVGPFGLTDESGTVRSRSSGKVTAMQIRCKFGQLGPGKGQFNSPHGFCLGMDEDIVVADTNNHRVQIFDKTGEFKYQFGIPGREEGQLWYPRKVAVIRTSGKYVVCDRGSERSRMQIFTKTGQFIKKIAIRYIDIVAGLAITSQGHIVAVDSVSPTVFCISETGDLIRWFDCSDYMREPSDIAISGKEYFVCDFKGHCVVVFNEDGQFLHRIGCENITNYPNGIDISDAGDVLIGDSHGNRFHIAVFQRDGSLIGEFECPYVKVSRCCGLKITSEGYVVTLAKNNQHVLVLNTLYIA